jgi:putrescine transport system ATP-binding protein
MASAASRADSTRPGARRNFAPWADPAARPLLRLDNVTKRFAGVAAVEQLSLDIYEGEFFALLGPSGCGKTTLLRLVAGFEAADEGRLLLDGEDLGPVPPHRRPVNMMFQSYALFPHLSVEGNVAFGLRQDGLARAEIAQRVAEMLALVQLDGLQRRKPHQLSGGQRQRVALSRALVQDARVCVLDEPISHLDAKLRHALRGAIRRRLTRAGVPAIWTSPDALETVAVADRVAVLVRGRVRQVGTPDEVYRRPATLDVARLVGDPPLNLLRGEVVRADGGLAFRHAGLVQPLPAPVARRLEIGNAERPAVLGLRPAEIGLARDLASGVAASVWVWEPLGRYGILSVRLGEDLIKLKVPRGLRFQPGEIVRLDFTAAEPLLFDPVEGVAL